MNRLQEMITRIKQEDDKQKEIEKIRQLFNMQDYAKHLLFNSTADKQEERARSFLARINLELKMLYIPTPIENV